MRRGEKKHAYSESFSGVYDLFGLKECGGKSILGKFRWTGEKARKDMDFMKIYFFVFCVSDPDTTNFNVLFDDAYIKYDVDHGIEHVTKWQRRMLLMKLFN